MYYISECIEDEVNLKGTKLEEKSKKLSMGELEEFAKNTAILGYNKLTHKIKISSAQSVVNHLKAKLKLLGEDDYTIKTKVMNNKEVLSCEVDYIIEPCKDVCNVRLVLPKFISDEVTVLTIDWYNIFVEVAEEYYEEIDNIIFDFELPEYVVGSPYVTSDTRIEPLRINNITFTDKFNMNKVRGCSKMFYFEDTTPDDSNYNFRTCDISLENCIDTTLCTIDLSKYTANNLRDTTEIFYYS